LVRASEISSESTHYTAERGSSISTGSFTATRPGSTQGASLTIRGDYPHERYFSFTVASQLGNGSLGGGDFLRDDQILADSGSINPFVPTNRRDATPRSHTVQIVQGASLTPRAPNTIYTVSNSPDAPIHLAMRNYIADLGYVRNR
jgi:hypothetical protein